MAEPKSRTAKRRRATKAPILDLDATDVTEDSSASAKSDAEDGDAKSAATQKSGDKAEQQPSETVPAASNRGGFAMKAAGIAAVFVAGAAVGAWLYRDLSANYAPAADVAQQTSTITALQERIAKLESQSGASAKSLEGLAGSVADLEKSVGGLDQSADLSKALEAAETARKTALEATTKAEEAISAGQNTGAQAADALSKAENLTTELASTNERINTLRSAIEAAAAVTPGDDQVDGEAVKALQASLSALALKVSELENAPAPSPADTGLSKEMSEKLTGLTGALDAVNAELAAAKAASADQLSQLTDLQEKFSSAQNAAKLSEAQSELAKALASLRTAVAEGKPFLAPVELIRTRFPDDAHVQVLAAQAADGVATTSALIAELARVRQGMENRLIPQAESAEEEAERSTSLFGTLQDRLSAIVKVRPAGTRNWAKLVEQMEASTKRGELNEAVSLADGAADAPPEALAAWLKRARARVAVDRAVAAVSEKAMAELANAGKTGG